MKTYSIDPRGRLLDALGDPTRRAVFERLAHGEATVSEITAGLADPKIKARFRELSATTFGGSPSDFARYIAEETEKWGKVIRAANIKPV